MPHYRRETMEQKAPWIEIDDFEVLTLEPGVRYALTPRGERERLMVLGGAVLVETRFANALLKRTIWVEMPEEAVVVSATMPAEVLRISGRWQDVTEMTVFTVRPDRPYDCHYHDSDAYWFIFRGTGSVRSEGNTYPVQRGDMVATASGHEHGFFPVTEPVEAVEMTTSLRGARRKGQLSRDTHGDPHPPQA